MTSPAMAAWSPSAAREQIRARVRERYEAGDTPETSAALRGLLEALRRDDAFDDPARFFALGGLAKRRLPIAPSSPPAPAPKAAKPTRRAKASKGRMSAGEATRIAEAHVAGTWTGEGMGWLSPANLDGIVEKLFPLLPLRIDELGKREPRLVHNAGTDLIDVGAALLVLQGKARREGASLVPTEGP